MKIKNLAAATLVMTLSASLLSGCFAKPKAVKQTAASHVDLVYYKLFDDEDVMTPLIQQYEQKHPNVNIVYRKFTDPEEYQNLILNELAEGQGPDIFSMPNYWFLRNAKKISPMPLNMATPQQFSNTFVNVAANDLLLRDSTDGQTKIFGLPMSVDTLALYYNKSQYEDQIPSRGRPAETWSQLQDDVYQLSKKDNSFERFQVAGIAMGRSDNILRAVDILYMLMLQYKTTFYDSKVSQAKFSSQLVVDQNGLNINPATAALDLYTSFALPTNKNYSWNQYLADSKSPLKEIETFARGKVSMIFGYSYLYDQIQAEIKDLQGRGISAINPADVKIAAVPQVYDPNSSTQKRDAYANYFAETVSRTSQNPTVAWDFLNFITTKDSLSYYNQKTHHPTSRRDMVDQQMQDPLYGVFAEQTGYADSFPIYDAGQYSTIFSQAIDSVLATTVESGTAMKTAEDQISALLPSEGLIPDLKSVPSQATQQTTAKKSS